MTPVRGRHWIVHQQGEALVELVPGLIFLRGTFAESDVMIWKSEEAPPLPTSVLVN